MLMAMILILAALSGQATNLTAAMKADVERMVARAEQLTTLWPWQGPIPEIELVVRHGKAVAPALLALLDDDPDDIPRPMRAWQVQQQAALALCRLYGVPDDCGSIYCNRASREQNRGVKRFWQETISER